MENLNAEEIKMALERCIQSESCEYCEYNSGSVDVCSIRSDALALIKSQEQKVKELTVELEAMRGAANSYKMQNEKIAEENEKIGIENFELICELSRIKENTVQRMQERLHQIKPLSITTEWGYDFEGIETKYIDQVAQEVLDDTKNYT